jgi:hypothetical protein
VKPRAELWQNMETASEKHREGIVHSILEANQVATIGSITGLGFLCCGLAPWDVNQPLRSHHLREGPAPVPHLVQGVVDWMPAVTQAVVDDMMRMSRPGGSVARLKGPGHRDHRFAPATP